MVWLPDGEKSLTMLAVLMEYRRACACVGQMDRQTDGHVATA